MKLSFGTLGCPDWTLGQIADGAVRYGFHGVEMRTAPNGVHPALPRDERSRIRDLFAERGLDICCISGYSQFAHPSAERREQNERLLKRNIALAADLGAPCVRTFIGDCAPPLAEEDAVGLAAGHLAACCEFAAARDVRIAIETHHAFRTGKQVRRILDRVGNDGIGVIWDIHHTIDGGETLEQTYEALGDRIVHVHLKDASEERLCLTGEGELPVGRAVELLLGRGYRGYFSLEWEKAWIETLEEPDIVFPHFICWMNGRKAEAAER